ncbi:hypothetical protein [Clostridium sp. KNHs205]|jgi:hypothetical protein|nr:hypothetical protein [Clostridium sp. KNHs205]
MEYNKPIYVEVNDGDDNVSTNGIPVVLILAAIIAGGVSGCTKD